MTHNHPQYPMINHMGQVMLIGFLVMTGGGLLVIFLQWAYNRFIRRTPPPTYSDKPKFFDRD